MSVIDLFAGPGGWDLGAQALGLDPVGLELDDAACATRRAAGLRTMQCDVAAVDFESGWLGRRRGGLIASPPCQGFSSAGKGQGRKDWLTVSRAANLLALGIDARAELATECRDHRSMLVVEPLRWALALNPEWVCFEQVPAVLPFWRYCAELLEGVGYSTWTGYLHAEQYGVPQTRKRAFLIASRVGRVAPPVPTHSKYYARDKTRLDEGVLKWVSMAEALGWDEDGYLRSNYGTGGDASKRGERLLSQPAPTLTSKADRMKFALRGNHSIAGVGRATRPAEEPALTIGGGARSWTWQRPATTVNCDPRISAPGRHDPEQSGSQQKDAIRVTVEQAAILQSFPADYPWQGTKTKQFEQIGNAVPPGLALPVLRAAVDAINQEIAA